jgi:hypothetical protein
MRPTASRLEARRPAALLADQRGPLRVRRASTPLRIQTPLAPAACRPWRYFLRHLPLLYQYWAKLLGRLPAHRGPAWFDGCHLAPECLSWVMVMMLLLKLTQQFFKPGDGVQVKVVGGSSSSNTSGHTSAWASATRFAPESEPTMASLYQGAGGAGFFNRCSQVHPSRASISDCTCRGRRPLPDTSCQRRVLARPHSPL